MRSRRDFALAAALRSIKIKPLFRVVSRSRTTPRQNRKRLNARRTSGSTIKRMRRKKHCSKAIKAARRRLHLLCRHKRVRRLLPRRQSNALSVPRQFARKPSSAATAVRSSTRRGGTRARQPFIKTGMSRLLCTSSKFGIRLLPVCSVFSFPARGNSTREASARASCGFSQSLSGMRFSLFPV